jgi:DivIVA domain-containing protein
MDDVQGSDNLSGAELRQARFPQSRRGYDRESVHAFLDRVADWVEAHTGVNADPGVTSELEKVGERTAGILTAAEEAAAKLRTEAKDYADELRASAEDEARKTKLNASQKADEIISEAESKAEGIIDEAIARRRRLNQAVTSLIERREEIAEETQGMAEQLLEAVEAVRLDEPLAQQALDAEPGEADEVAAEDPDATPPDGSPVEGAAPDPRIAEQPTELEPPDERETTVHETRQG